MTAFELTCWVLGGYVVGWFCSGYASKCAIELAVARRTMELREELHRTTLKCIELSGRLRDLGKDDV